MKSFNRYLDEKNKGLWANIHAKRKRGEKMRKPGEEGAPTDADFKRSQAKEAVEEKTLTPAEKKKREEIAKAMERDNPGMPMAKKMAIATATAKKVAEGYRVHAVSKDGEKMKSGIHPTKKAASDMHYKMAKSGMYKKIEVVKESVELDEGIENMSHGRLKWHMNTGVPHGSYTKAELKKERDRRLSRVDTHAAYKKAKPSMNEAKEDDMPASPDEASMALKQLEFIEYAAEEMMDHIKSGKPFPEWFQNKLSKAHGEIEGLHSAMGEHGSDDDEDMKEATELDEISLSHLSNAIAKSTGTRNIKTAMKPGEVKKGLDDLKKRLGTLGKEPQKESTELDEAQLDKMKKISPGFDDRKKAERHNDHLVSKKKASHKSYVAKIGDKYHVVDMKEEADQIDELSKKTLGSYVKKASRDVANRSADNARDVAKNGAKPGLNKKTMKNWRREIGIDMAVNKMTKEAVVSADKKPEKYIKPDGTVGIRMVRTDKKVVDKDA